MIKAHFYKCGQEPGESHYYYNHSTGLAGFLYPQDRKAYLGYHTVEEAEKLIERKHVNRLNRRRRYV